ncbi:hypothetical protein [Sphaerimonospora thailandensis]|uniref:Uncharacterized protein n=1 Tax=Sphaerimonospora thailandensis TaxID=795644 RepID=A0A8J3VZN8_9ACTN|nr:hypothetical protein [Sphaerimonospora thailandensis]GIH70295.1 hypothetical protein Mth01_25480 [Sphaerimonospora thailandensis]
MLDPAPQVHAAQIWARRADESRQFFVLRSEAGQVRGWSYQARTSATWDRLIPLQAFLTQYRLVDDAPHLREAP